jgi:hypothetical protein
LSSGLPLFLLLCGPSNKGKQATEQPLGGTAKLADKKDAIELLKAFSVTSDGKKVIIDFVLPRETMHKMIERRLKAINEQNSE